MKMSDRHKLDRPREKLQAKGASALSDFELLQALIGSGNAQADVSKIARETRVGSRSRCRVIARWRKSWSGSETALNSNGRRPKPNGTKIRSIPS